MIDLKDLSKNIESFIDFIDKVLIVHLHIAMLFTFANIIDFYVRNYVLS